MNLAPLSVSRRQFIAGTLGVAWSVASASYAAESARQQLAADDNTALIAITLDLEMSRNFPTWETTHWDFEKGNLNPETKKYTALACRRVKAHGGVIHCFAVGRVLEQENVDWLKGIVKAGHPVGNHTYDHVNVKATRPQDIQFRFQRAPWLITGKTPRQVILENIRLTSAALKTRIGIKPAGFRTPGGFGNGLADRPDMQQMLLDLGFSWVSSKYPPHPIGKPKEKPTKQVLDSIVKAQEAAQPFVYPRGLVEVPMSPISDISAFRGGRWKLDSFLKAIRLAVEWTIANRAVFDFLAHPSCLYVTDPKFQAIDLICDLVRKAGKRAALVDLDTIAARARLRHDKAAHKS
jgi:peptidoglycan/xylan/chitin deacetylase (PgdA/CDA1 family)